MGENATGIDEWSFVAPALQLNQQALRFRTMFLEKRIRELPDRGVAEKDFDRQGLPYIAFKLQQHLRREQGISAQFEEVIIGSNALPSQKALPDCSDLNLQGRTPRLRMTFGQAKANGLG